MSCQNEYGDVIDEDAVEVEVALRAGAAVTVRFNQDEIRAVFGAVREGEKTTAFIREAVFALVAQRDAETSAAAFPEAGS